MLESRGQRRDLCRAYLWLMDSPSLKPDPTPALRADDALARAARSRREADWALPMEQRLARLHQLCKQMSAVKGSARRR